MKKLLPLILLVLVIIVGSIALRQFSEPTDFSQSRIDIGMVVSDIEVSVLFYKNTLGFTELKPFNVAAEFSTKAGLTDGQSLAVRVLVVGEGDNATRIKLMQIPNVESSKSSNEFIHSQLGLSYITVYVRDMSKALKRMSEGGAKALAKGPVLIADDPDKSYLTLVADPDGNLIELIGPKLAE